MPKRKFPMKGRRVIVNDLGSKELPWLSGKAGEITSENRLGDCWRIAFDGERGPPRLVGKEFVAPVRSH